MAKKKTDPPVSFKLLMPNADGTLTVAAHVVKGQTLAYDADALRRFRLLDYYVCNDIPYAPETLTTLAPDFDAPAKSTKSG